jgi:hypothetical protein
VAWQDFYVIGGAGDDLAGGNGTGAVSAADTGGAGTVLQGGGAGGGTMDRYSAASGTPFSATSVGDWISIYTGAASAASYIAKVTAVNAAGASVDYDSTTGLGTRPANASTWKAKTGGAWNSSVPLGNMGTPLPASNTRFNIKAATYNRSGNLTISVRGSASVNVWYRGYNATPGDLDNGSASLSYPTFNVINGNLALAANFAKFTGLIFQSGAIGTPTAPSTTCTPGHFYHCQFVQQNAGVTAYALASNAPSFFYNCSFSAPATAAEIFLASSDPTCINCTFTGAGAGSGPGINMPAGNSAGLRCEGCTFYQCGGAGIAVGAVSQRFSVNRCTFYQCGVATGTDAITYAGTQYGYITNSRFVQSGSYDINNTGTAPVPVFLANNLSYAPAAGHLNGFGDNGEFNALTDAAANVVSSTDLHLLPASAGAGAAMPGQWEGQTAGLVSRPDVGAWQRYGGLLRPPGMTGGMGA